MQKTLLFLFSDLANKLFKNYPNGIYLFFTLCLSVLFFSCENEPLGASDPTNEVKAELPYTTKSMSLKDVPEVESYLRSILSNKTNKSATSKSINDLEHGASFDIEKIVETTDSISNKNYSIRFVFDDTPENVFYNLVINFLPSGEKHAFVQKQTCNPENYVAFRNSRYDMNYFNGKIDLFYYTAFFGKQATAVLSKTTDKPCPQSYYPNGDPIPTLSSFITPGGNQSAGGSSSTGGIPNSTNGNASWPATGGYGLSVFSIGNNQSSSDSNGNNTSNNSGGGLGSIITNIGSAITGFISSIGTAISNSYQNTFRWLRSFCSSCDPLRKTTDPCPTIVPLGFTTFISEPERLAILRSQIPLTLEQWQWLHGKDEFMDSLLKYINSVPQYSKVEAKSLALQITEIHMGIDDFNTNIKLPSFDPFNTPWLKKLREYAERIEKLKDIIPSYLKEKLDIALDNSFIFALNITALNINPNAYLKSDSYKESQFKYNGKNAVGILLYEFANGLGKDKRDFYFSDDITQQMLAGNVLNDIKNDFLDRLVKNGLTYKNFVNQGNMMQGGYSFSPDHTTVSDSFNKHVNANWVQFFIGGTIAEYKPSNEIGWIEVVLFNPTSRNSLLLHKADSYERNGSGNNKPLSTIIQRFHFKLKIN